MIVNHVSEGLNGVEMHCTDVRMVDSATTTIQIVGGKPLAINFLWLVLVWNK